MQIWSTSPLDIPGLPDAVQSPSFAIETAFQPQAPHLARIAYDNAASRATVTATSAEALRPASNLRTLDTFQTWRPEAVEAVVTVDFDAPETVNFIGLARHNMGSLGIGGTVEIEAGGDWLPLATLTPEHDGPLGIPFDEVTATGVRVTFDDVAIPTLAVLMVSRAVIMERPLRATMQPVWLSRATDVSPQISERGQLLGSVVVRAGVQASPQWRNLSRDFYNSTLRKLARDLPGLPTFLMWQPLEHPDEVIFGHVSGDAAGDHIARSSRYDFGFSISGVAPG